MTDPLTNIDGVGPAIADKLRDAGFETVVDVMTASVDDLADVRLLGEATARAILDEDEDDDDVYGGRPTKLTRDREETICETVRSCYDKTTAADRAGVTRQTINNWFNAGQEQLDLPPEERDARYEFFTAYADARADAKAELLGKMEREEIDWRMVAWKLERLYPEEFHLKIKKEIDQRTHHSGEIERSLSDDERRQLAAALEGNPET